MGAVEDRQVIGGKAIADMGVAQRDGHLRLTLGALHPLLDGIAGQDILRPADEDGQVGQPRLAAQGGDQRADQRELGGKIADQPVGHVIAPDLQQQDVDTASRDDGADQVGAHRGAGRGPLHQRRPPPRRARSAPPVRSRR